MKVYIKPTGSPAIAGAPLSQRERALQQFADSAAERGIVLTGEHGTDEHGSWVSLDVSGMRDRDVPERYRPALLSFLNDELGAESITVEPSDVLTLRGARQHDPVSYSVASRLRDGHPEVEQQLTLIEPDAMYESLGNAIADVMSPQWQDANEAVTEARRQLDDYHLQHAVNDGVLGLEDLDQQHSIDQSWESLDNWSKPTIDANWGDDIVPYRDPFSNGGQ